VFPFEVKRGSVSVKIYRTPSHGCDSFTLSYWQDGGRKRPTFPTFDKARDEAETVATRLGNADADVLTLTSADRASYLRARELANEAGIPLEVMAAQGLQLKRILGDTPPLVAAEYYMKKHPSQIPPRAVSDVIEEMLKAKQGDGLSDGYLRHLRYDLEKFAGACRGNIGTVSGADIDTWLRGLKVGARTRNNLRNAVQTLFGYAKKRKYLPKDHDELDAVARAKDGEGEIEIFTPPELAEILTLADERAIPFLTLGAFAGIRHAEIQRLDWRDIHFDAGIVEIRAKKAKTASRRTVPLLDNLRAWLLPHRQPGGPVCVYRNMASEINRLVGNINKARNASRTGQRTSPRPSPRSGEGEKRAAFAWKHNALRHSFISYRVADIQNVAQVALEAGNSPQMIFKHYRELVRPADAKTWFSIAPEKESKVAQLQQKRVA
jgi:integrase